MKRILCHLASILIYNKSICTKSFNGLFTHSLSLFECEILDKKIIVLSGLYFLHFFIFLLSEWPNNGKFPSLLSSLHNQCHGQRGEVCRKMKNVWTKDSYFSRKSKTCGPLFELCLMDCMEDGYLLLLPFVWPQWPICCLESSKIYFRFHTETCMILQ